MKVKLKQCLGQMSFSVVMFMIFQSKTNEKKTYFFTHARDQALQLFFNSFVIIFCFNINIMPVKKIINKMEFTSLYFTYIFIIYILYYIYIYIYYISVSIMHGIFTVSLNQALSLIQRAKNINLMPKVCVQFDQIVHIHTFSTQEAKITSLNGCQKASDTFASFKNLLTRVFFHSL